MANCSNCGAALPAETLVCPYCRSRNDVDLRGVHEFTVARPDSARTCPRCRRPLASVDLKLKGTFLVERCPACFGLFFDPNELEALLEASLAHADSVRWERLEALQQLKRRDEYPVAYIPCPVCAGLMNRINWGARSGVIVDRCRSHGVWLDGGELRRILEWAKAGGAIHDERVRAEQERQELRAEKERLRRAARETVPGYQRPAGFPGAEPMAEREEGGIVRLILHFLDPFF